MSPRRLIGPEEHVPPPAAQVADLPMFAAPAPVEASKTAARWRPGPDLSDVADEVRDAWYAWLDTTESEAILENAGALARAKLRGGDKRLFIDKLIWELRAQTPPRQVNNNLRSCLARWLMWRHPELEGRFQVREHHARKAG